MTAISGNGASGNGASGTGASGTGASGYAIRTEDLRKTYKSSRGDVPAVRGIDLSVESGQFFGLLGPNGAGKPVLWL